FSGCFGQLHHLLRHDLELFLEDVDAVHLVAVAPHNILGKGTAGGASAASAVIAGKPAHDVLHLIHLAHGFHDIVVQTHGAVGGDVFIRQKIILGQIGGANALIGMGDIASAH